MQLEPQSLEKIWEQDYLERRSEADYLTKYLCNRHQHKPTEKGFVLAVNAEWGVGKTFMLRKWNEQLIFQGQPAVYFDAWSNDFTPNPLIAFIAILDKALEPYYALLPTGQKIRRSVMQYVGVALKPALKVAMHAGAKKLLGMGSEEVAELIDAEPRDKGDDKEGGDLEGIGKDLSAAITAALKEHTATAEAVAKFKEKIGFLIKELHDKHQVQLPIFVFVDELDRCRPDYAIELLEGIKHLFGVPGMHFIVATNITQLGHSVCAIYGPQFNGEQYLKRFFDLEYSLPKPDTSKFAADLMIRIYRPSVSQLITGFTEETLPLVASDTYLPYIFVQYALLFRLELRDQEQVARILEACFLTLDTQQIHVHFLIFLVMLYHRKASVFRRVVERWSIDSRTGIDEVLDNYQRGKFELRRSRPNSDSTASHTTLDAVGPYFTYMRDKSIKQNASSDFPDNLMSDILQDVRNDRLFQYAEIVQRAGQFTSSKKKK